MYKIGQIFENTYTPEVADWCNQHNCMIIGLEPVDGVKRYEIIEIPVVKEPIESEEEKAQRIANYKLTGTDVERAILKVKGMDFDDILDFVTQNKPEGIDIKALKVELKANHFYRGNPYVNAVGTLLGFTKEQLDNFFTDGNYKHLLTVEEETVQGEQ